MSHQNAEARTDVPDTPRIPDALRVPHQQGKPVQLRGMTAIDHRFVVPLDHLGASSETLEIFAREIIADRSEDTETSESSAEMVNGENSNREKPNGANAHTDRPWLLYLQGGPGFGSPRMSTNSGWLKEATKTFRVLLLDQRGTGLSTPANQQSLAHFKTDTERAGYLTHFRADSIVRDAELVRSTLGINTWSTLGQSFGGFCTLTYLSMFPGSLDRSLITGGLAPISGPADRVYRATFSRMRARNEEYFAKYPEDRIIVDRIVDRVRNHDEYFSDGRKISVGAVQMLGMFLGGNARIDQLHFHLETAFIDASRDESREESPDGSDLSDTFKEVLRGQASFASGPLYAVLHESIYGQQEATNWAASRILEENLDFHPDAESPLLTGEMIYPWHFDEDPALQSLKGTANLLAQKNDWPDLYRSDVLANNAVPVAAAVYADDVYVDRDLSLETAQAVNGLQVWETADFHHDGLADDGAAIFKRLLDMTNGTFSSSEESIP